MNTNEELRNYIETHTKYKIGQTVYIVGSEKKVECKHCNNGKRNIEIDGIQMNADCPFCRGIGSIHIMKPVKMTIADISIVIKNGIDTSDEMSVYYRCNSTIGKFRLSYSENNIMPTYEEAKKIADAENEKNLK